VRFGIIVRLYIPMAMFQTILVKRLLTILKSILIFFLIQKKTQFGLISKNINILAAVNLEKGPPAKNIIFVQMRYNFFGWQMGEYVC
jgi:hypothetical protein